MKDLFRKEAVDGFRKQFFTNKKLSRISFSTLVMTALLIVGLKLFSVWFFHGTVIRSVDIEGVLYPPAGMEKVCAFKSGIVTNVNVEPGDTVKMGEVLVVIPDESSLGIINYNVQYGGEFDENNKELDTDKIIENDRLEYTQNSFVRSVTDGTVVSVAQRGSYLEEGDVVALIAADDKLFDRNRVIVFLPTEKKSNIHEGDSVQISPDYVKREKHGYIQGHVHEIGKDIISKKEALEQYNFYNIPNMLDEDKTYVTVMIALDENENYDSGLAWSRRLSEGITPELGTYCSCSIITGEETPVEWLFGGVD